MLRTIIPRKRKNLFVRIMLVATPVGLYFFKEKKHPKGKNPSRKFSAPNVFKRIICYVRATRRQNLSSSVSAQTTSFFIGQKYFFFPKTRQKNVHKFFMYVGTSFLCMSADSEATNSRFFSKSAKNHY